MKAKTLVVALLALVTVAIVPPAAWSTDDTRGEAAFGARATGTSGSLNKASEYRVDESVEVFRGWWDIPLDASYLWIDLDWQSEEEQDHLIDLDLNNSVRVEGAFQRFVHNTRHDPLTNVAATDTEGKIVHHDDFDPRRRYGITWEEGTAGVTWQPENAREWIVRLHARQMRRRGIKQNISTGHCMTCHVISQTQEIDEKTRDVTAELGYQKPNWGVSYAMTVRDYSDDADDVMRYFENAQHPVWRREYFNNRVTYDDVTLPVRRVVEHDKMTQVGQFYWDGEKDHVDANLTFIDVEADESGLEQKYTSFWARWLHDFGQGTSLILFARYEEVETDSIFIDVVEQVGSSQTSDPDGPWPAPVTNQAGLTYADVYGDGGLYRDAGFVADYTRRSAADRKVFTARADVLHRYGERKKHRAKLRVETRNIDREFRTVDDDEATETEEYLVQALFTGKAGKHLRYRGKIEVLQADNTFKNVNGAIRADANSDDPRPGPWFKEQYFELYRTRFGDLTNVPSSVLGVMANATYSPTGKGAVNVHASYKDSENDETDVADWTRESTSLGAWAWWTPSERVYAMVSADVLLQDQETLVSIPLMNG